VAALVVPPAPTARVNDYAGLLAAGERARLEAQLAAGERATGAQVVVAIFPALEGESLEDFAVRLAERWRIGQKGLDNGAILLVFVRDRKLRLEVGYGLEPLIPDVEAGRIIREVIAPSFREGRYAAGLERAVETIYRRLAQPGAASRPRGSAREAWLPWAAVMLLAIVIGSLVAGSYAATRRLRARRLYTLGPNGWYVPTIPPTGRHWGGGGGSPGGGFSGGGGEFGGGGASGDW
jgi:uncharacterized protein